MSLKHHVVKQSMTPSNDVKQGLKEIVNATDAVEYSYEGQVYQHFVAAPALLFRQQWSGYGEFVLLAVKAVVGVTQILGYY